MIPLTDTSWQSLSWQDLVIGAISNINDLTQQLNLPQMPHYSAFPIKVPLPYLSRIELGNPQDPLLRQVLCLPAELQNSPGFTDHPLDEANYTPLPGLIQKYQGRVLIIVTGSCAINCRYCFRRHFPYQDFQPDSRQWQLLFEHIHNDDSITEVILSGGDPLMLPDKRLQWIESQLAAIPHITTLRLHTRLPVVIPQRICPDLLNWIAKSRLNIVFVNHVNHANEIDAKVIEAMQI